MGIHGFYIAVHASQPGLDARIGHHPQHVYIRYRSLSNPSLMLLEPYFPLWVQNNFERVSPQENIQFVSQSNPRFQNLNGGSQCEHDAEFEQKRTFSEGLRGYVELPYTLPQDFTLFVLMKEKNIEIWKKKLDWIAEKGGMALFNSHPDYMNFNKQKNGNEEYAAELYIEFLEYIKNRYKDQYWHALPKDIARFWQQNYS